MDRKLSPEILKRRRLTILYKSIAALLIALPLSFFLVKSLRSGLSRSDIYTSTVDRGVVEIAIAATGRVVPLSEEIIISPVSSKLLEVYKKAGDSLHIHEPILKLDLDAIRTDVEQQNDQLEMKRYKLEQQRKTSESQLQDMQMQLEIDRMRLKRIQVLLRNEIYLDSIGASTSDKIKQTELEYAVAQLQLQQLELKYRNLQLTSAADLRVQELDYRIALKNATLKNKQMQEAQIRSPRTATLTWVNDQIGSQISQGAQLAIVSDLAHYKVESEIAETYGNKVLTGHRVIVRIGEQRLTGIVGNVVPSVKNGMINFIALLDKNNHPQLRSGLKVDVYVINAISRDALRIANRSYYTGKGEYDLWVIKNREARKRKVLLGESSYDYVEVKSGLTEGETVITSDMQKYTGNDLLKIRD
jgi:HlyD family secretion protein